VSMGGLAGSGGVLGVLIWPRLFPAADGSVADGPGRSRTGLGPGRVAAPEASLR